MEVGPLVLYRLTPGKKSTVKEKLWEMGEIQGCASSGWEEQCKEGTEDPACWPVCPGGHVRDTVVVKVSSAKQGVRCPEH